MKNIHVLKTDKPSRLVRHNPTGKIKILPGYIRTNPAYTAQNIYITNDEQAKEGDWGYIPFQGGDVKLVGKYFADDWKKIILTTDQDLIKNGVQAIDDEFLEWFVENPSCEEVELENHVLELGYNHYKISIPKEEPKQETPEEAAERLYPAEWDWKEKESFIEGAKWYAERMYSEEEVKQIIDTTLIEYSDFELADIPHWFEQFKKK